MGDDAECQLILSVDAILDTYGFIPEATAQISDLLRLNAENIFCHLHSHAFHTDGRP